MSDTNDFVTHANRKLFEAGDYPDKQFEISAEELAACAGESHVDIDSGHPSATSPLDGKLGYVTNRRVVEENGKAVLRGDVVLPTWLNDVLEAGKSNLSCTWDRAAKALRSVSLVQNPRIPDAVLMSAYAEFAGKRHSDSDLKDMQEMHDITCRQGAQCKPAEMAAPGGKERNLMTVGEMFAKLLGRKPDEQVTPEDLAEFGQNGASERSAVAPDPKVAILEAQLASLRAAGIQKDAIAFAEELVREGRLTPPESGAVIAEFCELAEEDATAPKVVTFSVGDEAKTGTRLDRMKARLMQRPAHQLFERVPGDGEAMFGFRIPDAATPKQASAEERARLLSLTPLGQATLNGKGN